jgi:hypothetical protein
MMPPNPTRPKPPPAPRTPEQEVRFALEVLFRAEDVVELRVPEYPRGNGTTAGYFSDSDALVRRALEISAAGAAGVYVTLNEIDPNLLARYNNRTVEYVKRVTADGNVRRRRWLLLDFDAVRLSLISATDAEHTAALTRARAVRDWLARRGWTEPVVADSGNGAHLLYAIDLPNDAAALALVGGCLRAVAARFDDEVVTVDVGVGNAAHLCKLYGTHARKGDGAEDRPHRMARILSTPKEPVPVPPEKLEVLAAEAPAPAAVGPRPGSNGDGGSGSNGDGGGHPRLDFPRWLKARGVEYRLKPPSGKEARTIYRIVCPSGPARVRETKGPAAQPGNGASAGSRHTARVPGKSTSVSLWPVIGSLLPGGRGRS